VRSVSVVVIVAWAASACSGPRGGAGDGSDRDEDRDGYSTAGTPPDCDDGDPFVHPGAAEHCDGVDGDCDGEIDGPEALGQREWFVDGDGDGFGVPGEATFGCDPGPGWSEVATDCDDANVGVHPRRDDPCNGRDDDCDGEVDEDPTERWFVDADGDGFGDPNATRRSCEGTAPTGDDCDDGQPTVYPGAPELCDGLDNDCDSFPDAYEAVIDPPTWYADLDRDGFGVESVALVQCVPPNEAWALQAGDCDDLDPEANPGAIQRCVARDTDCDGLPGDERGWFAPDAPVRIPLEVTGTGAESLQPVTTVVDFRAALDAAGIADPFDPSAVVVAVQDCQAGGAALPTAAVDALGDVFGAGDPTGVDGDEAGLLAFVLDRPLALGEVLPLAVYVGGAPPATGALVATEASISGPLLAADFDPDRGGTVDAFAGAAGVRAVSQADAREGNGIRAGGAWTQLSPASTGIVADLPAFAAIATDGTHGGAAGDLRIAAWWFAFDGVPALYGRLLLEAGSDLVWDDPLDPRLAVRPFEAVPLDLVDPVGFDIAGGLDTPGYAVLADDAAGVALAWVEAPADPAELTCADDGCRIAATEGQGAVGAAAAGERLIDHRLLVLVSLDAETLAAGADAIAARVAAARTLPSSALPGVPEARP
jgi:hypothetical protein